jgi:hypothetical protein
VTAFYFAFSILGLKGSAIPWRLPALYHVGSLFITHKAMGVLGAKRPASAMMKHAPMNTIVSITCAIASLYIQCFRCAFVLYLYHVIFVPITIVDPIGAMGRAACLVFRRAVGMIFYPSSHGFPVSLSLASSIYAVPT